MWTDSISDEGLKESLGQFESQDQLLEAIGYSPEVVKEPLPWSESIAELPEDLKKVGERFTSQEDVVRAIQNFQKREGQVRVPGKNATDEELAAYRKAIGIPEDVKGYELDDSRETMAEKFLEWGIPSKTAKDIVGYLDEAKGTYEESQIEEDKAFAKSQEDALRDEWKGDYDQNKTYANRAFKEIADRAGLDIEELSKIETKDGRFLLDRAEIVKMFASIGKEMGEGTLGPISEGQSETISEEIEAVRKQIAEAQGEGNSKKANKLFQKEQALLEKLEKSQRAA